MYQVKYYSGHLGRYVSRYFHSYKMARDYANRCYPPRSEVTINSIDMESEDWEQKDGQQFSVPRQDWKKESTN